MKERQLGMGINEESKVYQLGKYGRATRDEQRTFEIGSGQQILDKHHKWTTVQKKKIVC